MPIGETIPTIAELKGNTILELLKNCYNTLKTALGFKQNTLTAGDNVSIEDDVISATDTTYTAGDNITIEGTVISATDTTYTAGVGITIENNVISAGTSPNWEVFSGNDFRALFDVNSDIGEATAKCDIFVGFDLGSGMFGTIVNKGDYVSWYNNKAKIPVYNTVINVDGADSFFSEDNYDVMFNTNSAGATINHCGRVLYLDGTTTVQEISTVNISNLFVRTRGMEVSE